MSVLQGQGKHKTKENNKIMQVFFSKTTKRDLPKNELKRFPTTDNKNRQSALVYILIRYWNEEGFDIS